jgi:hypothetical protein
MEHSRCGSSYLPSVTAGCWWKAQSGVKYILRNFLRNLFGREPEDIDELNMRLHRWIWEVAKQRVHGTTRDMVKTRWQAERSSLEPVLGRAPYAYVHEEPPGSTRCLCGLARNRYSCRGCMPVRGLRYGTKGIEWSSVSAGRKWHCIRRRARPPGVFGAEAVGDPRDGYPSLDELRATIFSSW